MGREHAVPVRMVVTAEPLYGSAVPLIDKSDIRASQDQTSLPVTELVSLQGDQAGLELYILIDEKVNPSPAARFDEIRRFVASQAATTAVGIAYMHNGEAKIVQTPTKVHARAAQALVPPTGSTSAMADPFNSLSELINGWSAGALRREVLVVSDGVDVFENVGYANMFVDIAVQDAQRAGVQVFCFYAPSAGHASHSPALIRGGQADPRNSPKRREEKRTSMRMNWSRRLPSIRTWRTWPSSLRTSTASRFSPRPLRGIRSGHHVYDAAAERGRDLGAPFLSQRRRTASVRIKAPF